MNHSEQPGPAEQQGSVQAPATPQVSAILIGYNQAPALRRAIEALERSQNREQLEILLVDCASTDGTGSLDENYPGVTVMRMPDHFGATKALNVATRTARAELLFYLSPNVEVAPDTIAKLVESLEAASDTAAACPLLVSPRRQARLAGRFLCPRAIYFQEYARAEIRRTRSCQTSGRNPS